MNLQTVLAIVVVLAFIVVVIAALRTGLGNMRAKPGYADLHELTALRGVIAAALQAKGIPLVSLRSIRSYEPPYRDLLLLQNRLGYSRMPGAVLTPDEVATVAPFAEQWLADELPHLLAREYDDEIRVPLLQYKARMRATGLWPRASMRPV